MSHRTQPDAPVLLDVDGVLLDTTEFFDGIWRHWAHLTGLDDRWVSAQAKGRRTEDILAPMATCLDVGFERRRLHRIVEQHLDEVMPTAGGPMLLAAVQNRPHALVTSSSRWFVEKSFGRLGLPLPSVCVYGEDVTAGKPAPDGYLLAAARLGVPAASCIAVDDTEPGVMAAVAAGCTVVAVGAAARGALPPSAIPDTVENLALQWSGRQRIA